MEATPSFRDHLYGFRTAPYAVAQGPAHSRHKETDPRGEGMCQSHVQESQSRDSHHRSQVNRNIDTDSRGPLPLGCRAVSCIWSLWWVE